MENATHRASIFVVMATMAAGSALLSDPAPAKTPGKTYCYNSVCHRVKTLAEME